MHVHPDVVCLQQAVETVFDAAQFTVDVVARTRLTVVSVRQSHALELLCRCDFAAL